MLTFATSLCGAAILLPLLLSTTTDAFEMQPATSSRRALLEQVATAVLATSTVAVTTLQEPAWASGGATAGKYTTIPIAKRRYYGRVQQAVHEFVSAKYCCCCCFELIHSSFTMFTICLFVFILIVSCESTLQLSHLKGGNGTRSCQNRHAGRPDSTLF